MNTRTVSESLREKVLSRDGKRCRYCGSKKGPFHLDHVYPFSKGGETSLNNLVTACEKCNKKKNATVGIYPKPIGYFDGGEISFISGLFSIVAVIQFLIGSIVYFTNPQLGFMLIIIGAVCSLVSAHTKRI